MKLTLLAPPTRLTIVLAMLHASCSREPLREPPPSARSGASVAARARADASSTPSTEATFSDLIVLPNNVAVHCKGSKVVALDSSSQVIWETTLPGDVIIAPMAAGMNSVTYIRGKRALHAVLPGGKLAWSTVLNGQPSGIRELDAPVALTDSTPALVVGNEVLRFDHAGAIRWRLGIPDGKPSSRLSPTMAGFLLIPSTAGIYLITPEGTVAWRHAHST